VLELLVGCGGWYEEAPLVARGQAADYAGSCYCGVANGYDVLQFGFEDTVERLSVLFESWQPAASLACAKGDRLDKVAHL
jgi:hypothetical protein